MKIPDSWDEIANWVGADRKVLMATIDEYNAAYDQGYATIFAKERVFLVPLLKVTVLLVLSSVL